MLNAWKIIHVKIIMVYKPKNIIAQLTEDECRSTGSCKDCGITTSLSSDIDN